MKNKLLLVSIVLLTLNTADLFPFMEEAIRRKTKNEDIYTNYFAALVELQKQDKIAAGLTAMQTNMKWDKKAIKTWILVGTEGISETQEYKNWAK